MMEREVVTIIEIYVISEVVITVKKCDGKWRSCYNYNIVQTRHCDNE